MLIYCLYKMRKMMWQLKQIDSCFNALTQTVLPSQYC